MTQPRPTSRPRPVHAHSWREPTRIVGLVFAGLIGALSFALAQPSAVAEEPPELADVENWGPLILATDDRLIDAVAEREGWKPLVDWNFTEIDPAEADDLAKGMGLPWDGIGIKGVSRSFERDGYTVLISMDTMEEDIATESGGKGWDRLWGQAAVQAGRNLITVMVFDYPEDSEKRVRREIATNLLDQILIEAAAKL